MSGRAVVSVPDNASTERKIKFLLDQVEGLQQRISELENRVRELPQRWAADIDTNRADVEDAFRTALEASRNEYIGARLLGLPLVVVGASMLAASSFVG